MIYLEMIIIGHCIKIILNAIFWSLWLLLVFSTRRRKVNFGVGYICDLLFGGERGEGDMLADTSRQDIFCLQNLVAKLPIVNKILTQM